MKKLWRESNPQQKNAGYLKPAKRLPLFQHGLSLEQTEKSGLTLNAEETGEPGK